jgi:uncharacterized damage-inducible protein DinB
MSQGSQIGQLLLKEAVFRIRQESLPRIQKCLDTMSDEDLWKRPNTSTVSVGNLILHLEGNVRQWILAGIGGQESTRNRDAEFSELGPLPKENIGAAISNTVHAASLVLQSLPPEDLTKQFRIQGFEVSGVSVVVHVVEHFSYHTGQITFMVKSTQNIDTGYYNQDLNQQ